jgi:hypothetical protein
MKARVRNIGGGPAALAQLRNEKAPSAPTPEAPNDTISNIDSNQSGPNLQAWLLCGKRSKAKTRNQWRGRK